MVMTRNKLKRRIEAILKDGGDMNGMDHNRNTLLHITLKTCPEGEELATLLLESGTNVQLQNGLGETPLMFAVRFNPGCVSLILMSEYGKDTVKIPSNKGYYPIHCAAYENNIDVVKLLFDNGAFIGCKNSSGQTPLHCAAKRDSNAVDILLRLGVEVNCKDDCGRTPLHLVNIDGCITKLLSSGAQLNIKDDSGWTPLHYAVKDKHFNKVALLLQIGAEVNSQDNGGKTPLHLLESFPIISDKIIEIGNTLLDWGASLTIDGTKGRTPSDICLEVVYCAKQQNVRRACVKLSDPPNDLFNLESYKTSCLEEAERLKLVRFGQNSLYDVFEQYSDPEFLKNEPLKEALNINDYGNQFPIYSSLLKYTYKRAKQRAYLLETAADTLKTHSEKVFQTTPGTFLL